MAEDMDMIKLETLVHQSFEEVFFTQVVGRVNSFLQNQSPATAVVMVPSLRDMHHDPVFPQPAFRKPTCSSLADFEVDERITFARNPETIRCRGVDIGLDNIDMLKYFSMGSLSNLPPTKRPGERMGECGACYFFFSAKQEALPY